MLVAVGLCGWAIVHAFPSMGGAGAIRDRFGFRAALFLVPLHALVAVSPLPGEIVAVLYAPIYGFALGAVFGWIGWLLAAITEYSLYRRIAHDAGPIEGLGRLPACLRRLPVQHPAFLFGVRFVPFGNQFVNTTAGLVRVPFLRFLWPTALALIPIAALISALSIGFLRP
jgi:uncharacterized membrane protein YdjX (TVP38/TMEM64 family)